MTATPKHPIPDLKYWAYNQPGQQVLRDVKSFLAAVYRGLVPGAEPFAAYGRYVSAGAIDTPRHLWPGPTPEQPYHPTGDTLFLQSDSPDDTFGGAGVQQVEIHYIDAAGYAQSWITQMDGVTPVPLPEASRFIQCLQVMKGAPAVGNITVENAGGDVYSIIPIGYVRCASAMRFVPVNKRFFMVEITGGSGSGTAAATTELNLVSTELDAHGLIDEGLYIPHKGIVVQDNSLAFPMAGVFPVSPGQIVGGTIVTDGKATMTMSYDGWLEDL